MIEVMATFASLYRREHTGAAAAPARDIFPEFLHALQELWHSKYAPRLVALRADRRSRLDPALDRGHELELFRSHHETVYSSWLKWLLSETNPAARVLQPALVHALAGGGDEAPPLGTWFALREPVVREGHDGHGGRLDILLINEPARAVITVENKVRAPSEAEVMKHAGYIRSIEGSYPRPEWRHFFTLLVPDPDAVLDPGHRSIRVVGWRRVAACLRRMVLGADVDSRSSWQMGLVVSAIEGHVLDYPVGIWREFLMAGALAEQHALTLVTATGYLDYLEDCYAAARA